LLSVASRKTSACAGGSEEKKISGDWGGGTAAGGAQRKKEISTSYFNVVPRSIGEIKDPRRMLHKGRGGIKVKSFSIKKS